MEYILFSHLYSCIRLFISYMYSDLYLHFAIMTKTILCFWLLKLTCKAQTRILFNREWFSYPSDSFLALSFPTRQWIWCKIWQNLRNTIGSKTTVKSKWLWDSVRPRLLPSNIRQCFHQRRLQCAVTHSGYYGNGNQRSSSSSAKGEMPRVGKCQRTFGWLLRKPVPITKIETQDIKTKNDALTVSLPILSMMEGFKLDGVHPHRYTIPFGVAHTHMYNMMENPLLLAGEKQFQLTVTTPYSGLIVFITGD